MPHQNTAQHIGGGVRYDTPKEDRAKFRQVFLYLVNKLADNAHVGKTSLHKLLYYIDFDYYEIHEEQLMGLRYIRNEHGPTARMFSAWTSQMAQDGLIEIRRSEIEFKPVRYLPAQELTPDLTADEMQHIDQVISRLEGPTGLRGGKLRDLSHNEVPWLAVKKGADLEYEDVFYRTDDTSVRDYPEEDDD